MLLWNNSPSLKRYLVVVPFFFPAFPFLIEAALSVKGQGLVRVVFQLFSLNHLHCLYRNVLWLSLSLLANFSSPHFGHVFRCLFLFHMLHSIAASCICCHFRSICWKRRPCRSLHASVKVVVQRQHNFLLGSWDIEGWGCPRTQQKGDLLGVARWGNAPLHNKESKQ